MVLGIKSFKPKRNEGFDEEFLDFISQGDMVFVHSNHFPTTNPTQGVAWTAFQTIKLVVFHKFQDVIFEVDSKGVIESSLNLYSIPQILASLF